MPFGLPLKVSLTTVYFTIVDEEVLVLSVRGPGQDYVDESELPESPDRE
jgi:hypothetical protein